jgi:hypothetical protein
MIVLVIVRLLRVAMDGVFAVIPVVRDMMIVISAMDDATVGRSVDEIAGHV